MTQVPCNTLVLLFKSSHLALYWFTSEHSSDYSLYLLQMSCHPELNQYIQDTLHCVKPLLEKVRSYRGPWQNTASGFDRKEEKVNTVLVAKFIYNFSIYNKLADKVPNKNNIHNFPCS